MPSPSDRQLSELLCSLRDNEYESVDFLLMDFEREINDKLMFPCKVTLNDEGTVAQVAGVNEEAVINVPF